MVRFIWNLCLTSSSFTWLYKRNLENWLKPCLPLALKLPKNPDSKSLKQHYNFCGRTAAQDVWKSNSATFDWFMFAAHLEQMHIFVFKSSLLLTSTWTPLRWNTWILFSMEGMNLKNSWPSLYHLTEYSLEFSKL